ncbi:unnamed protein product [marine sediment metagenome]|uniref:Uncharacterized protein n=1 Tax=marine sediment metagenome TaxID=412755 RepID=X1Q306_9ZZZZ
MYLKVVLTGILVCLALLTFQNLKPGEIQAAKDEVVKVDIVGISRPLPVNLVEIRGRRVYKEDLAK